MPSKEQTEAWKKQLIDNAEQQILNLTDSEKFKNYLNTVAKFHRYSSRNINLIYSQNPEATQIAGFKQWKTDFNRSVNKGEKSIRIVAPIIKKLTPEEQKRLDTTEERGIVGYRYIPVFDISQTSGEPVLSAKDFVKENLGEHKNVTALYNELKDYLNNNTDLKVSEKASDQLGKAKGYFSPRENEIVISKDEPDTALKLKTLFHEYAHSQLHGLTSEFANRPREYKETQAEAVAYVAMQNIGVDTSDYSLGYVATWAKDKNIIHQALGEIQKVSNKVIDISDTLTEKLELQQEQKSNLNQEESSNLTKKYKELTNQKSSNVNNNQKEKELKQIRQEISKQTQKELHEFTKENPTLKKNIKEIETPSM